MTYEEALEPNEFIKKVFRADNYRPYRLPIDSVIHAPADPAKQECFMKAYLQHRDWHTSIQPYKEEEELQTILLFKDPNSDDIFYTTYEEFISLNNIRFILG